MFLPFRASFFERDAERFFLLTGTTIFSLGFVPQAALLFEVGVGGIDAGLGRIQSLDPR
ncbi:hypothetical protein D3C77_309820 [compost metagenome]